MLEIVRGRNWSVAHTVLEGPEGPPTVLSQFSSISCQIREKVALRNIQGFFEHKLVTTPSVVISDSVFTLKLTAAQTTLLQTGEYLIDVVADNESLLDPEPVKIVNRPTQI